MKSIPIGCVKSFASVLFALAPILMGGAVYVLWRSPSLWMFKWFNTLGLASLVEFLRDGLGGFEDRLPRWIVYSWPDGSWGMSGVLFFAWIWRGSQSRARHVWIFLTPFIGIASEFAQWGRLLPGTFDQTDLALYCLATLAGVLAATRFYAYEL